jgi:hypothetical protein
MIVNDLFENVAGPEKCWPGHRKVGTKPGTGKNAGKRVNDCEKIKESTGDFNIGDPVIITGEVEFQGKTGDVREIGRDGAFVVVNLYNHGPQSFHASDVSFNDYADSDEEEERTQGVAEGEVTRTPTGIVHKATDKYGAGEEPSNRRDSSIYARDMDRIDKQKIKDLDSSMGITWKNRGTLGVEVDEQLAVEDNQEKVGNMPADKFDSAMARLKQLAGAGPLKTVWDPQKRVYKNMPTAVQPKK